MAGYCTSCGSPLKDDSVFCGQCGAPIASPSAVAGATPAASPVPESPSGPPTSGTGEVPPIAAAPLLAVPAALPPTTPRRRNRWLVLVGAVVAIIVVIAILVAAGVIPIGSGSASTTYGVPAGSTSSLSQMNSAVAGYPGGPWTPIQLMGIFVTSAVFFPSDEFQASFFSCDSVTPVNAPSSIAVDALHGSLPSGMAAFWFAYYQSTSAPSTYLLVASSGNSSAVYYSGSGCAGELFVGTQNITGLPVNSTLSASVANANGGSEFAATYSVSTALFLLAISSTTAAWAVAYSSCSYSASGGSGYAFAAGVNADTGAIITTSVEPTSCD